MEVEAHKEAQQLGQHGVKRVSGGAGVDVARTVLGAGLSPCQAVCAEQPESRHPCPQRASGEAIGCWTPQPQTGG